MTTTTMMMMMVMMDGSVILDMNGVRGSLISFWSPRAPLHVVGMLWYYVKDRNQPSLPTPFYPVLVSISVFVALSTVFHFINSPNNTPLSHSVLPVLILPYWSFQPYVSFMKVSLSPDIILCSWPGLKHRVTNNPKFLDVQIWAYLEISCLVRVFKVTLLSMHPLGQPFKPCDHGARPRWLGYVRNHALEEGSSIFETASPSTADSL